MLEEAYRRASKSVSLCHCEGVFFVRSKLGHEIILSAPVSASPDHLLNRTCCAWVVERCEFV